MGVLKRDTTGVWKSGFVEYMKELPNLGVDLQSRETGMAIRGEKKDWRLLPVMIKVLSLVRSDRDTRLPLLHIYKDGRNGSLSPP